MLTVKELLEIYNIESKFGLSEFKERFHFIQLINKFPTIFQGYEIKILTYDYAPVDVVLYNTTKKEIILLEIKVRTVDAANNEYNKGFLLEKKKLENILKIKKKKEEEGFKVKTFMIHFTHLNTLIFNINPNKLPKPVVEIGYKYNNIKCEKNYKRLVYRMPHNTAVRLDYTNNENNYRDHITANQQVITNKKYYSLF